MSDTDGITNETEEPMDDNVFWLKVMKAAFIAVCFITVTIGSCTANRHYQIRTLVQSGVDPISAKCAIEGEISQAPICIQRAAK